MTPVEAPNAGRAMRALKLAAKALVAIAVSVLALWWAFRDVDLTYVRANDFPNGHPTWPWSRELASRACRRAQRSAPRDPRRDDGGLCGAPAV